MMMLDAQRSSVHHLVTQMKDDNGIKSKLVGSLLGGAVGDAIVLPVEFMAIDRITSPLTISDLKTPQASCGPWTATPNREPNGSISDNSCSEYADQDCSGSRFINHAWIADIYRSARDQGLE